MDLDRGSAPPTHGPDYATTLPLSGAGRVRGRASLPSEVLSDVFNATANTNPLRARAADLGVSVYSTVAGSHLSREEVDELQWQEARKRGGTTSIGAIHEAFERDKAAWNAEQARLHQPKQPTEKVGRGQYTVVGPVRRSRAPVDIDPATGRPRKYILDQTKKADPTLPGQHATRDQFTPNYTVR
jgi:hypothetical protein